MLIALLTVFLLGGGSLAAGILTPKSVEAILDRVEEIVSEKSREKAAEETLKELESVTKKFAKRYDKVGDTLSKQFKDHESNAGQMLSLLQELNVEWEDSQRRAVDLRFALKASLTAEEWRSVFGDG